MEQLSKICFSTLIVLSMLANYISTSANPSELSLAQAPETAYEAISPEYFSYPPEIGAPAPEIALDDYLSPEYPSPPPYADIAFSPEAPLDDYLPPDQYPSPPPPPPPSTDALASGTEDDEPLPPLEAPVPAPSVALPLPSADDDDVVGLTPLPYSTVVPYDSTADDEVVEYDQQEQGSTSGGKSSGAVVGVIIGVCIVGLAGFVLKKKKDNNMRRTQYQYLAKREEP